MILKVVSNKVLYFFRALKLVLSTCTTHSSSYHFRQVHNSFQFHDLILTWIFPTVGIPFFRREIVVRILKVPGHQRLRAGMIVMGKYQGCQKANERYRVAEKAFHNCTCVPAICRIYWNQKKQTKKRHWGRSNAIEYLTLNIVQMYIKWLAEQRQFYCVSDALIFTTQPWEVSQPKSTSGTSNLQPENDFR